MASFYGGSPGLSMMIVKSYLSPAAMKEDFNSISCTVGIGECVCIDSGLNDGEHGNIYRRTTSPENPEYVGNMSGPMGPGISFAATVNINETIETPISKQINTALGISDTNPITDTLKLRSILCKDSKGALWIYAYNYKNDGTWVRVASYDGYIITNPGSTAPVGLAAGGLWIQTQNTYPQTDSVTGG